MKYLASFRSDMGSSVRRTQRCEYIERIIDMLEKELEINPELTTVIPFDIIKYVLLPYIQYTPLDFYDITIDETPCLYQSFDDEIYEKIPTSLKTLDELNELAKTLYRQFLIREGYLYQEEDETDFIDPSLDDRGNLCARFKYEVGHLIRLTPKYKFVSEDSFVSRSSSLEHITLNYPEKTRFKDHVYDVIHPVYHRVHYEIQKYNEQVINYLSSFRSDLRCESDICCLCVKCLTHLKYRPELNNLMTMIINDPDMIKIVKEEGIKLVLYDEEEE
jgi:hypothetical protein